MRNYSIDRLVALLPFPAADVNKYSRGKVILVAGSARYPGAAALAAFAASRMGAGYTEVFTESAAVPLIQTFRPSLVAAPYKNYESSILPGQSSEHPLAYVIGCGFDIEKKRPKEIMFDVLAHSEAPILVDGGGLSFLATKKGQALCQARKLRGFQTVLTPHMGEAQRMAALVGIEKESRKDLASELAKSFASTVVLKDSNIFIADDVDICVISHGSSALAKAGTGDVLAGMIGALLAQSLETFDACVLGATLHANAGNAAAQKCTPISVGAEDVIEGIPQAIFELGTF